MVTFLNVRDGNYTNLPKGHRGYYTIITMVDAKGFMNNTVTKEASNEAKKKAIKLAKKAEKDGWKLVCIKESTSYGYKYPYRYEILSFGGYSEK